MRKISMYYHGGSGNHGCEAIVRATKSMFGQATNLYSFRPEEDYRYELDKEMKIVEDNGHTIQRNSIDFLRAAISHKLKKDDYKYICLSHKEFFSNVQKGDVYMSVGGDNYCYKGQDILGYYNKKLSKCGVKTVLWGCSIEPEVLKDSKIQEDIKRYDLITTRESISYKAIKNITGNVVLCADPAFTLNTEKLPLPENWDDGNMIGINASPLILKSAEDETKALEAYRNLMEYILSNTSCKIALIPHVVWKHNDDRVVLKKLYDEFRNSNRVLMIQDCNAMQLKGYISRCEMFIGARTHATIAAYSTCVPTLVLGYSVKSRGIARDIFGQEEHYVVPIKAENVERLLVQEFRWQLEHKDEVKKYLEEKMPDYIKSAYLAKERVEAL